MIYIYFSDISKKFQKFSKFFEIPKFLQIFEIFKKFKEKYLGWFFKTFIISLTVTDRAILSLFLTL